jgi:eukaryotic-like serine/threonine-protein kinase
MPAPTPAPVPAPPAANNTNTATQANAPIVPPPGGNAVQPAKPDLDGHVDQVLDSGALIVSGKIVNLFGIRGDDGRPAQAMRRYLKSKSDHVECFAKDTNYQCLANGEDIAEHAVRNGWARTRDGAPADYAAAEQEARRAHAGVWAM